MKRRAVGRGVIPVVVVAVMVGVAAAVDVHVLAAVVGVWAAAEAGCARVAEAEGVGGEVEGFVGVGGRGGDYAHGLSRVVVWLVAVVRLSWFFGGFFFSRLMAGLGLVGESGGK